MYVYGVSSLPSLAKSPSAGKKTHTKRKVIVVLYLGNLLKKKPFSTAGDRKKKTCLYKTAGCWSTEQVCYLIQFVTFSPSSPAHLTRMLLIWLVGCRKEIYPTGFFRSGLSIHVFTSKHWTSAEC